MPLQELAGRDHHDLDLVVGRSKLSLNGRPRWRVAKGHPSVPDCVHLMEVCHVVIQILAESNLVLLDASEIDRVAVDYRMVLNRAAAAGKMLYLAARRLWHCCRKFELSRIGVERRRHARVICPL
jgi:hypothetical protein